MAKQRSKKKNKGDGAPMEVSSDKAVDMPQSMDTCEAATSNPALKPSIGKIKKGIPLRRAKNMKKQKTIARAVINSEKSAEKVLKSKNKMSRIQSAKTLYE
ncbi:uncharacterized protein LOC120277459 [Dioscorea cayenensis subsp. rotundata]|uniref:Uncharacterized protein LOC120277459 n=1 Tax=Dioscorea cayennensis subsp. rotundata TaxID=55577 RepID=A0AB40CJL5_DIOCR|nr:uncharacterized protein LOC120277459 [Dioscorea cayenensis subsp. rotundata]